MTGEKTFQEVLESWFLKWVMGHRNLSAQTVASYRDAFRLLFAWVAEAKGIAADRLGFDDLDRDGVLEFLEWLRIGRNSSAKTVNCRLTAIRSFAAYVASECPERAAWAAGITSIKRRKESRPALEFLAPDEVASLEASCDCETPEGRRDAMMVRLLYNTGFRITELVELRASSFSFGEGSCHVSVVGKGRKERTVPIWQETAASVASYMSEAGIAGDEYLFPGRNVSHLTRSGARSRLDAIVSRAAASQPSLAGRKITPHTMRHSTAMAMLAAGVDLSTIAMWLGHDDISTTHKYMVASMELKEKALAKAMVNNPFGQPAEAVLYKPDESILAFLDSL